MKLILLHYFVVVCLSFLFLDVFLLLLFSLFRLSIAVVITGVVSVIVSGIPVVVTIISIAVLVGISSASMIITVFVVAFSVSVKFSVATFGVVSFTISIVITPTIISFVISILCISSFTILPLQLDDDPYNIAAFMIDSLADQSGVCCPLYLNSIFTVVDKLFADTKSSRYSLTDSPQL